MTLYQVVVKAHLVVGTVALTSFWITAALSKGTLLHRRTGGTYLVAMVGVMITAIPLAGAAFGAGHTASGVFLSYLVLITATPVWTGWRAVRDRRSVADFTGFPYRPLAWLNIAAGLTVFVVGMVLKAPLLWGLSLIGLYVGTRMARFAASAPTTGTWWLKHHYTGIVASGIAAHIAFLNVGLQRALPAVYSAGGVYVAWFAPVLVATIAVWWINRRYGRGADGARLMQRTA